MNVTLRTSADRTLDGICPECKEWTTAGDSCCGRGAYVEGGLITDESAEESLKDPCVSIKILENVPHSVASSVRSALFKAGVFSMFYGNGGAKTDGGPEDKWTISISVPVASLPRHENEMLYEAAPELLEAAKRAMDEYVLDDPESKTAQLLVRAVEMATSRRVKR